MISLLTVAGSACQKNDPGPDSDEWTPEAEKNLYVSSTLLASASLPELQAATTQDNALYRNEVKYDVDIYKLVYTTTYQGKAIQASGLVCVPKGMSTPAPILSMQHGTIFAEQEAPSHYERLSDQQLLASAGYVTLIPDYIGFGESKQIFHPYFDQRHSALAVIDMIKAAKLLCKEKDVALNDKLFLTGYSEGGYVTLAAQQEIETNAVHGLKVTASAAGAGGYDVLGLVGMVTSGVPYYFPVSIAYLLQAYNYTYTWHRPLTDMFQNPYASELPKLFNGVNTGMAINEKLPQDIRKLLSPTFYAALQDNSQELRLKRALYVNSFPEWTPQSPTRLYHGTNDIIIPFQNSKETYQRFVAQGAKKTEFIPVEDGTHESAYKPMMQSVVPWLKSFSSKQ
ncbi:alpha/beta hydrolase family protein [Pontibacter liquoris]|uniref:alpha/beta hydrolase family protein n=1 Tax=Pontibacter liquoris TaxID=2905677 RepID=UPI001FA6D6E8|nr:lipase family protein [Pontibacter liquoris]